MIWCGEKRNGELGYFMSIRVMFRCWKYIYIYIYIVCVWIIESFFLSRSGLLLVLEKKERGGKKKVS